MTSTRIRGKKLRLTLGTPGEEVWQDVTNARIEADDLDTPTFGDIADGSAQFFLRGTAIQSTDATSFWRYVWDNAGDRVAFAFAIHGNIEPSVTQPHFVGYLTVGRKPGLGGDVNSTATFEFEWEIDGMPALDEGA
ncbi:hypothetical protein LQ938_09705 [Microbacterium sp. cx-55]|uniref:hypothetical protein n=1 Tax=Microbacterium sp. cx-55 TaxID=2875948 RepID=UPI001CBF85B1|nr:hypothetical protein [Microbacterium sp. cx-55]MBZ4485964.1 hypothetical protein [Microbacterium sp. cx-55]UGB34162.1 hypothetical protein LQ938_09705 [Microbacterium sp. cx-55]